MTREEAIKYLIRPTSTATTVSSEILKQVEAYNMAIEALSADSPHHIENNAKVNDLVFRPSADRPTGEWQKVDEQPYFRKHFDNVCCSVCHHKGMRKYNYCPSCGAKMKGGAV